MNLLDKLKQLTGLVENGGEELLSKLENVQMSEEVDTPAVEEPQVEAPVEVAPEVEESTDWTLEDKIDFLLNKEFEREDLEAANKDAVAEKQKKANAQKVLDLEAKVKDLEGKKDAAEKAASEVVPDAIVHNPEAETANVQRAQGFEHPNSIKSFDQTDLFFKNMPQAQA